MGAHCHVCEPILISVSPFANNVSRKNPSAGLRSNDCRTPLRPAGATLKDQREWTPLT
jgi:hypothetical protein